MDSAIEKSEIAIGPLRRVRGNEAPRSRVESNTLCYTVGGVILGFGAPAGALVLRVLSGARMFADLRENAFFYLYDLVGTCFVFAVAGFLVGRRADRLQRGRDQYQELSERDSLTSLVNARTFRSHYERALAHAARFGEPLSLLLIDVDQLKVLNDDLGHSFGSAALVRVAEVLESSKRVADVAARWGGDEFTLLMPGAGPQAARRQAEAILERLRANPVRVDDRERVISATVGVATAATGESRNLFEAADDALYAGKRAGRGQVRTAEWSGRAGSFR